MRSVHATDMAATTQEAPDAEASDNMRAGELVSEQARQADSLASSVAASFDNLNCLTSSYVPPNVRLHNAAATLTHTASADSSDAMMTLPSPSNRLHDSYTRLWLDHQRSIELQRRLMTRKYVSCYSLSSHFTCCT